MFKGRLRGQDGSKHLVLGLSRENCERLLEGHPIAFSGADVGFPDVVTVIIVGGETEESIAQELGKQFELPKGTN